MFRNPHLNVMMSLKTLSIMLESHNDRDKVLRLLCYTFKLIGGITKDGKYSKLSDELSECRTTLRLLDDIPMLIYSLSYGLGKKEPDTYMQVCGVVVNVLDQLYYPFEHVAWAADKGLLSQRSEMWWLASNVCWTLSLYFNIARSLRYLHLLHNHSKHMDLRDSLIGEDYKQGETKKNLRSQLLELLSVIRYMCDFILAVHWMPESFLWAGRLKQWQIGALGTASSLLSLMQICAFKEPF
uniref:Peroxisomal membrane protein 11C n=1 Tax=Graphocephala atropunctata TaxID=36148 RepID=A0A1B6MGK4_9HEMI